MKAVFATLTMAAVLAQGAWAQESRPNCSHDINLIAQVQNRKAEAREKVVKAAELFKARLKAEDKRKLGSACYTRNNELIQNTLAEIFKKYGADLAKIRLIIGEE